MVLKSSSWSLHHRSEALSQLHSHALSSPSFTTIIHAQRLTPVTCGRPPSLPLHSRAARIGIPGNCCLWRHLRCHHPRQQPFLDHHRGVFLGLSQKSSPRKLLQRETKRTWSPYSDGRRSRAPGLLLREAWCSPSSMLLRECSGARCWRGHHVLHSRQVTRPPYFLVASK